jgi:hypothetical protein
MMVGLAPSRSTAALDSSAQQAKALWHDSNTKTGCETHVEHSGALCILKHTVPELSSPHMSHVSEYAKGWVHLVSVASVATQVLYR